MDKNRKIIIALIIVVTIIIIVLVGVMIYTTLGQESNINEGTNSVQEENNLNSTDNIYGEDDNIVGEEENVVNNTDTQNATEDENNLIGTVDEGENTTDDTNQTTQEDEEEQTATSDMEKLLFNSKFTEYLGNITGEQLNALIQVCQESVNTDPEHILSVTSNTIYSFDEVVATEIYTVTFGYDDEGYINTIVFDKKE